MHISLGHSCFVILAVASLCLAQKETTGAIKHATMAADQGGEEGSEFVVEQPGTITFKHGIIITGKVEKPQVLIFLPKEKSFYREMTFSRSFAEEMAEPMPFEPVIE